MAEALAWLTALVIVIALWLAIPVALRITETVPSDIPPEAFFVAVAPPWFYLAVPFNALVTFCFISAAVIRGVVLAVCLGWRRFARK